MKITLRSLRRLIKEELTNADFDAKTMAKIRQYDTLQKSKWASQPGPIDLNDLPHDHVERKYPGALDKHSYPDGARFWEEDGSLYAVDRKLGHKSTMIYGRDGNWHKYYNDAREEPPVDRRRSPRRFDW